MITLLNRPTRGTIRRPKSAPCPSHQGERVHAAVIVRRILARAVQAEWVTSNDGLAVMRWLDHLDAPSSRR